MPASEVLNEYGKWFLNYAKELNNQPGAKFDLLVPSQDLYKLDHPALLRHQSSHLWRFRPSALVIEIDNSTNSSYFHVIVGVSHAIALKDVGELNCYVRIMGAKTGCLVSPKGISNEVRLVQAESSVRDRLFGAEKEASLFLIEWDVNRKTVKPETVIPIERKSQFF
jgi:hypothetical protein